MNNFNPINNNIFNPAQNINASNKAGMVQNSQQNLPQGNEILNQNLPTTPQIFQKTPFIYDLTFEKMNNETVLKYLQNLLKLPESIEKFVAQIADNKAVNEKVVKILVENLISTKELGEFLNKNSQEAVQKILQTISTSLKSGISDVTQLKEVMAILGSIQSSTQSSNALKELMLLYIPLSIPVFDKEFEFGEITSEQEEKIKSSNLSIMYSTNNFSNMLCCLNYDDYGLFVDIYSCDEFPREKFSKIIQVFSKEVNLNAQIEYKNIKVNNKNENAQNLKVISQGYIAPDVLILSHFISKTIFKIDNDFSLNDEINV